ncbi:MAG: DUF86 domain-containing protein [Lachnospiraceae bacterium]|nr:DUF86 domain-containing protein [Lachnospiraceae bacterium]
MDDKDRYILKKIYQHIVAVLEYCEEATCLEEFRENKMRVEACVFNLMQIGELAKTSLSEELKGQITSIPWKQIYGMRNRIVHGYEGVEMRIVWDTIKEDLPILRDELEKYI